MAVVQSCRDVIFPLICMNYEVPTVLIDLWNTIETNYLVLSMAHGNITGIFFRLYLESSEMLEAMGSCNHRMPRGMVQGNRVFEVNGSLSHLHSPLRPGLPSGGITFLSFLSRVSFSFRLGCPHISFSFVFMQSQRKNFHSPGGRRFSPIRRSILD